MGPVCLSNQEFQGTLLLLGQHDPMLARLCLAPERYRTVHDPNIAANLQAPCPTCHGSAWRQFSPGVNTGHPHSGPTSGLNTPILIHSPRTTAISCHDP